MIHLRSRDGGCHGCVTYRVIIGAWKHNEFFEMCIGIRIGCISVIYFYHSQLWWATHISNNHLDHRFGCKSILVDTIMICLISQTDCEMLLFMSYHSHLMSSVWSNDSLTEKRCKSGNCRLFFSNRSNFGRQLYLLLFRENGCAVLNWKFISQPFWRV